MRGDAATMTEEREHTRGPVCRRRRERCRVCCFQCGCCLQRDGQGGLHGGGGAHCYRHPVPVGKGTRLVVFLRTIWRKAADGPPSARRPNYGQLLELFVGRTQTDSLGGTERNPLDLSDHAVAFFDAYYGHPDASGNFFFPRQTRTACETGCIAGRSAAPVRRRPPPAPWSVPHRPYAAGGTRGTG